MGTARHWSRRTKLCGVARMRYSMFPMWLVLLYLCVGPIAVADEQKVETEMTEGNEEESDPATAVLFPAFTLTIGVLVFWLLSRHAKALPYTAVMFLIGTIMGIGVTLLEQFDPEHAVNQTINQWIDINSRLLLLVFLPGLIFRDAFSQNVHLFSIALGQCLIFAFPMVLAGTTITAAIAFYVFPYNWSFNLCMTFGAILSATDPVAVAALLEQVGAPPRLKTHIAGEALLNDGAAIVFFDIFFERYLTELKIPHLGEDIGLAKGVAIFLRKSLGSVAIGLFFGFGLLFLLYVLDRRFNREENVVEVSATIAVAYLGYYIAEIAWETSGVLATVASGVTVKFLGRAMINDAKLLDDFWTLVEHLLNTVLFVLGGTVWGNVVAEGELNRSFQARDWGYLILLYGCLLLIRLALFSLSYPVTSRIGLKTNWAETLFQVYGGLRGAVGIALALALDNEVREATGYGSEFSDQTQKIFGFVGGIAFLTLCVNGITAGPLLRKMHLADSTESRDKIVRGYQTRFKVDAIDTLVRLLTQPRFKHVNFALVKHHVPYLHDLTRSQLMEAVHKHKDTTRPEDYQPPYLKRILPYLPVDEEDVAVALSIIGSQHDGVHEDTDEFDPELHARRVKRALRTENRMRRRSLSTMRVMMERDGVGDALSLQELRLLFISVLRSAYEVQIQRGELEDRQFLAIALQSSLDFAEDSVAKGGKLNDWSYVHMVDSSISAFGRGLQAKFKVISCVESMRGKHAHSDIAYTGARLKIERSLSFMAAHRWAQSYLHKEFESTDCDLSELGKVVLAESQEQFRLAEAILNDEFKPTEVESVVSHKFCLILLNSGVHYITKLVQHGLLKEQEAEHLVEEIEESLDKVLSCNEANHPGEYSAEEEHESLRKLAPSKDGLQEEAIPETAT